MNEKAQAFDAFKLLIAAIVAGAILVILLTMLSSIIPIGQDPFDTIAEGITSTKGTLGKNYISTQEVRFVKDRMFLANALSDKAQINKDEVCFCTPEPNSICPDDVMSVLGNYSFDSSYFYIDKRCFESGHYLRAKRDISGRIMVYHHTNGKYYVGFNPG